MEHQVGQEDVGHDTIFSEIVAMRGELSQVHQKVDALAGHETRIARLEKSILALVVSLAAFGVRLVGPNVVGWVTALAATIV